MGTIMENQMEKKMENEMESDSLKNADTKSFTCSTYPRNCRLQPLANDV